MSDQLDRIVKLLERQTCLLIAIDNRMARIERKVCGGSVIPDKLSQQAIVNIREAPRLQNQFASIPEGGGSR